MKQIKKHLFVCTNCTYTKLGGEESSPEEAITLRRNLKNRIRETEFKDSIKVSAVTCLGECESGIAAVLYPHSKWMLGTRPDDEETLFRILTDSST